MLTYKIIVSKQARKDLDNISKNINNKTIKEINKNIKYLEYMPRAYKTLIYQKDKKGEYRRMISGRYAVIYKIKEDKITIMRIFNQKQNYLGSNKFILKEETQKYKIIS